MIYLAKTWETPSSVYLLTELISGGDVTKAMEKLGGKLKLEDARFYVASLCIALKALHGKGIVYRDVKPDNLMLDGQGYLKVIDFGVQNH